MCGESSSKKHCRAVAAPPNITSEHCLASSDHALLHLLGQSRVAAQKLQGFASFSEASVHAKLLRAQQPPKSLEKIKVMFAENELQAQDLLCQVRVAGPKGDD